MVRQAVTIEPLPRMLAKKVNKPLVISLHDPLVTSGDAPAEQADFLQLLHSADRVVTTTETYRTFLNAAHGIPNDAMDTIYMRFPDVRPTTNGSFDLPTAGEPLRFAYCGQLHGRPGTRDILPLLTALESCSSKACGGLINWELHLAGNGPGLAAAEEFVRWSPFLVKRVQFHGYLPKDEAVALARRVHVNIILQGEDQFSQLPNKVFDLLPLPQPIFGIVPTGSEVHPILEKSGRAFLAQPGDLAGIFSVLSLISDSAAIRRKTEAEIPKSLLAKFSEVQLPYDLQKVMNYATRLHSERRKIAMVHSAHTPN